MTCPSNSQVNEKLSTAEAWLAFIRRRYSKEWQQSSCMAASLACSQTCLLQRAEIYISWKELNRCNISKWTCANRQSHFYSLVLQRRRNVSLEQFPNLKKERSGKEELAMFTSKLLGVLLSFQWISSWALGRVMKQHPEVMNSHLLSLLTSSSENTNWFHAEHFLNAEEMQINIWLAEIIQLFAVWIEEQQ